MTRDMTEAQMRKAAKAQAFRPTLLGLQDVSDSGNGTIFGWILYRRPDHGWHVHRRDSLAKAVQRRKAERAVNARVAAMHARHHRVTS